MRNETREERIDRQRKQRARIERSLTNQSPTEEMVNRIERLREVGKLLGEGIILHTEPSREQSLALTHLEETVMWAVKAIVLEEREEGEGHG